MNKMYRGAVLVIVLACLVAGQVAAQVKGKPSVKKTPVKKVAIQIEQKQTEPWKLVNSKERLVEIATDYGIMVAKLYDSTPLHRDNFVKLVEERFYDSLLFHRVIDQFMIQGGDPLSKNASEGVPLGNGSRPGSKIPAELKPYYFHKKGALAAARDNNPDKASSNCQFYIVAGKRMPEQELDNVFNQRVKPSNPAFTYNNFQKEVYARIGGTAFLDQSYTVFGEVISGLDVIDRIAKAPKDASDRPIQNVRMKIRILN